MSGSPSPSSRRAWLRRVRALVRKEFLQVRRDPSSYLIAGVLPLLMLFIYGYGVTLDLRRVPVAVVVERSTPEANSLLDSFRNSRYFDVQFARHRREVEDQLVSGRIKGMIVLASDFSQRLGREQTAPVQIIVDGSDPNTAGLVQIYAQGVWANWLVQESIAGADLVANANVQPAVSVEPRFWFNPEIRSQNFLIPGSLAIVMTLIGTLLTALVVAREWERGTIEALMATPIGPAEFLLGKLIPYFLMGMVALAISTVAAVFVFDVPLRGSLLALTLVSTAFLLAMLPLGLLISTVTKNQFAASQAALLSAYLPAFLLSGFIFEIDSMPRWISTLTYALPARYFVASLQTLFLAGDVASVLVPCSLCLLLIGGVLFVVLIRKTRMRLE